MDESKHLSLLDQYRKQSYCTSIRGIWRDFHSYEHTIKKLKSLNENEQQMAHRLDLIQFQLSMKSVRQIYNLNEDETLMEEKRATLQILNDIHEAVQASYDALQGEQKGLDWIGLVMGHLEDINGMNAEYKELAESVSNSFLSNWRCSKVFAKRIRQS